MPGPFTITAATNSIPVDADRRGETSFTVFNASGRPIEGRAQLRPEDPAATPWLSLAGEPERAFGIAEAHQYTVQIDVPPDASAGSYPFRMDMVGVENPDELYTEGPTVTFRVPEEEEVPPSFPWWIVAVVAAVLVIGAIAAGLLWPRSVEVPTLTGATIDEARDVLADAGLEVADTVQEASSAEVAPDRVIGTDPPAGTSVRRGSDVTLIVSTGPFGEQTSVPVDLEMSGVRLVGACESGLRGRSWLEDLGFRVGVTPIEDCPPPSEVMALLTFDVGSLPEGAVLDAQLDLAGLDIIGDPFAEFGPLIVEEVSFPEIRPGVTLLETDLGEVAQLDRPPATVDVTTALDAVLARGSRRFQVRLRYAITDINFRDVDEALATPTYYLVWNAGEITLDVTLTE